MRISIANRALARVCNALLGGSGHWEPLLGGRSLKFKIRNSNFKMRNSKFNLTVQSLAKEFL